MVGVIAIMLTSFKRTYVSKLWLPGQLYSVPLTPCQATVDPHLCQRLLDTHRQVWLSLLWGHLLPPGSWWHKVLLVPSKSLFPQSCGNSVIKSQWPPKSDSPGLLSPFAGSPGWGIWCVSRTFAAVQGCSGTLSSTLWVVCSVA